jgi:hypothetical protein
LDKICLKDTEKNYVGYYVSIYDSIYNNMKFKDGNVPNEFKLVEIIDKGCGWVVGKIDKIYYDSDEDELDEILLSYLYISKKQIRKYKLDRLIDKI